MSQRARSCYFSVWIVVFSEYGYACDLFGLKLTEIIHIVSNCVFFHIYFTFSLLLCEAEMLELQISPLSTAVRLVCFDLQPPLAEIQLVVSLELRCQSSLQSVELCRGHMCSCVGMTEERWLRQSSCNWQTKISGGQTRTKSTWSECEYN